MPALGLILKTGSIDLLATLATLVTCSKCAGVKMSTERFEAYGEPLREVGSGKRELPKTTSAIISVVGQCGFWLLVAAIIITRIAYFSPVPSFSAHEVLASIHSARR